MACGRAVASPSASALPEVGGSAAVFFDPKAPGDIARALAELLLNPDLRARMERLGLKRSAQFSWRKTAQQTLDVYRTVAGAAYASPVPAAAIAA